MSRTTILVAGAICWTAAIADGAIHLFNGDPLVPTAMAAVVVAWVGVRRFQMSLRRTA